MQDIWVIDFSPVKDAWKALILYTFRMRMLNAITRKGVVLLKDNFYGLNSIIRSR